jgi:hypothetical protein
VGVKEIGCEEGRKGSEDTVLLKMEISLSVPKKVLLNRFTTFMAVGESITKPINTRNALHATTTPHAHMPLAPSPPLRPPLTHVPLLGANAAVMFKHAMRKFLAVVM